MVGEAGETAITGKGFTVTVTVAVSVQPVIFPPTTLYVVVTVGLAVTVPPNVVLRPVAGDHA
jgi:hypothetical protein